MSSVSDVNFSLREHDRVGVAEIVFSILDNEYLYLTSSAVKAGWGWNFIIVDRTQLNGSYIRFRWNSFYSGGTGKDIMRFYIYDGTYDRSNDADFPLSADLPLKGNGILHSTINNFIGEYGWEILDIEIDVDSGSEDNITLFWMLVDNWNSQNSWLKIDWIEVNEASGGTGNIWSLDFDATNFVNMDVTGTEQDYGIVNNTGLPIVKGGYETDGYFITDDYLNYTTGNSLGLLTNTSIPEGTSLTVQFSNDNSTWVDNDGNVGSTIIEDGFYAIDLRNLNYTDSYKMVNFTGTPLSTPRLYQLREITTNGTAGNGVSTPSEDYAGLFIVGLIIGLIIGIGASRS